MTLKLSCFIFHRRTTTVSFETVPVVSQVARVGTKIIAHFSALVRDRSLFMGGGAWVRKWGDLKF